MLIENQKTYSAQEVEKLFFRPSFCGKSAEELGIRVIYNMPLPTTIQVFSHQNNILRDFTSGWSGGSAVNSVQKDVDMSKVKAESAYSAEEYFSTIYEVLSSTSDIALDDLSGTELEKAETELFRRAIVESVYASTWLGDMGGEVSDYTTFNGILRHLLDDKIVYDDKMPLVVSDGDPEWPIIDLFQQSWKNASDDLRALASEGQLVFFVSSDVVDAYQIYLDSLNNSCGYTENTAGRPSLCYHGIPIVEIPVSKYGANMCQSFCILTDRRNFVLALNTADSPEKGIRMWYNPDEMENRQRAVFLAGTVVLDHKLVAGYISHEPMMNL